MSAKTAIPGQGPSGPHAQRVHEVEGTDRVSEAAPINRAVIVRLYPNRAQASALRRWQGGLRFVWNHTWAWCKAQRAANDGAGK